MTMRILSYALLTALLAGATVPVHAAYTIFSGLRNTTSTAPPAAGEAPFEAKSDWLVEVTNVGSVNFSEPSTGAATAGGVAVNFRSPSSSIVGTGTLTGFTPGDDAAGTVDQPHFAIVSHATALLGGRYDTTGETTLPRQLLQSSQLSSLSDATTLPVTLTFDGPGVAAFGFYGVDMGELGGALSLTITDVLGNTTEETLTTGTVGSSLLFWGLVDNTGTLYRSVRFNNTLPQDAFGLDDLVIGTVDVVQPPGVPEPGTLALFGLALCSAGMARRRTK